MLFRSTIDGGVGEGRHVLGRNDIGGEYAAVRVITFDADIVEARDGIEHRALGVDATDHGANGNGGNRPLCEDDPA